jgi:hypothetical protein
MNKSLPEKGPSHEAAKLLLKSFQPESTLLLVSQ